MTTEGAVSFIAAKRCNTRRDPFAGRETTGDRPTATRGRYSGAKGADRWGQVLQNAAMKDVTPTGMQRPGHGLDRVGDARARHDEVVAREDEDPARLHRGDRGERLPRRAFRVDGGGIHLARAQLEDDLGASREQQLCRGLDGLAPRVGEDVGAAGRDQHVVQESDATTGVYLADGAGLAAEHEQRGWRAALRDARAHSGDAGLERPREALGRVGIPRRHPESAQGRENVRQSAVPVVEQPDPGACELRLERVLRAVDNHEVGLERRGCARRPDRAALRRARASRPRRGPCRSC